jgi:GNAT superfamily N-acetyltransferase
MEISFKPIEQSDIDTLLTFIQAYYAYDRHPFDPIPIQSTLENLIAHPDWGRVWFICRDTQPIGYVILTLGYSLEYLGRDAFVDEIYIQESDRGQGIGRATFQFVEEVCRSLEVKALHLEVQHSNLPAQLAYGKLGFVKHERDLMTRHLPIASR